MRRLLAWWRRLFARRQPKPFDPAGFNDKVLEALNREARFGANVTKDYE